MSEQITNELLGIDLRDKRLNERSRDMLHALSVDPQSRVNRSFTKWSDTLAAYRLLENDAVTPEAILKPHYEATLARSNEHPVVCSFASDFSLKNSKVK